MAFQRLSYITIAAVYILILVGGIVRSTGSGMGCPDWPKCFGSWVPPTREAQLPLHYQDIYLKKRIAKNERIAKMIAGLGFDQLAYRIVHDPQIHIEDPFNATKTWIEYINRLIGVVIGLLILATCFASFRYWRQDKWIPILSLLALIIVLFQAWLGSIVVSVNLLPFTVTAHMLLALLLVGLLIYIPTRLWPRARVNSASAQWLAALVLTLVLFQTVLGTQVRELVDSYSMENNGKPDSIDALIGLGLTFLVHRSSSWVVLVLGGYLWYSIRKQGSGNAMQAFGAAGQLVCLLCSMATGLLLYFVGIPAWAQPLHLFFGSLSSGFLLLILFSRNFAASNKLFFGVKAENPL